MINHKLELRLVAIYYGNPQNGVNKKVIYQTNGLLKHDINARILFLGSKREGEEFKQDFIDFLPTKTAPYRSFRDRLESLKSFRKSYEKVLLTGNVNEIIYLRDFIPAWWFFKAVKRSPKKIILELPSNSFKEALTRKSYFYYFGLCLFHRAVLRNVDLLISVTREIIDLHFNAEKWKIPCMVIGNGIDVDVVPLRKNVTHSNAKVYNLTCVAELSAPHGIDRLLKGLKEYNGEYIIKLNIVGRGREFKNLQALAAQLQVPNVVFHGFLSGKALDDILEDTDLGIGALAIHRSKIEYSSILKAREYCARGIPFVNSGKDQEFPEDFPFVLQIKSMEGAIDIEEMINFITNVVSITDYKNKMRQYAVDVLSWDIKMKKLSEYLYNKYPDLAE